VRGLDRLSACRRLGLAVGAALTALILASLVGCSSQASLLSLRDGFEAQRDEFASVALLAESHGDLAVAPTYSSTPTGPVPAQFRDRYKGFIHDVGAQRIEFYDGDIDVVVASEGLGVSGVETGYAHPVSQPDNVLPWSEIDTPHDDIVYFALEDGWYAYVYRF